MKASEPTASLIEILERRKAARGSDIFCRFLQKQACLEITFDALIAESSAYANLYRRHGLQPGGIVLIVLKHCPDLYYAFLGALFCGCVPSFIPFPSAKQDPEIYWASHRALFSKLGKCAVVTYPENIRSILTLMPDLPLIMLQPADIEGEARQTVPHRPGMDDIAFLQHSSGTTGLKKGIALSYRAVAEQVNRYAKSLALIDSDRIVSWLPLYHDMGLISSFILPLMAHVSVIFMDAFEWVEEPSLLFRAMEAYQGTHTWLPNFAFHHLCNTVAPDDRYDLSRMKAFIDCSEPCKPETFDLFCSRFRDCGVTLDKLQVCYAMAEAVFAVTQTTLGMPVEVLPVDEQEVTARHQALVGYPGAKTRAFLSVGKPIDGMEIKIVNADGVALEDGHIGEVVIRGASMFSGYYQLPEETQKKVRDGWYSSRDFGFRHRGDLYITGRSDDLFIVHGKNYYAHDIEFCAQGMDKISPGRIVAVGFYNPAIGTEEIFILAEADLLPEEEKRACQATMKKKVFDQLGLLVRKVELVPPGWLIKTTSGKLSRSENKKKYLAMRGLQAHPLDDISRRQV